MSPGAPFDDPADAGPLPAVKRGPRLVRRGIGGLVGDSGAALLPQARLSGPMPWVIAIMVALTVVAVASGLALRELSRAARADLSEGITVQIVHAAPAERQRQAYAALATLHHDPAVASARLIPQAELERMLGPWLGTRAGDDLDALPIPALIDVTLTGEADPARVAAIGARVGAVAPAARIDAQAHWLGPVFGAIGALRLLAGALVALLAGATAAAVVLAVRNALGVHRQTIEIVHMLGATDSQVAGEVQRRIGLDAIVGGLAGLAIGGGTVLLLGRSFAALGSGLVEGGVLSGWDWAVVCLVPAAGVALAVLTARIAVLGTLRQAL